MGERVGREKERHREGGERDRIWRGREKPVRETGRGGERKRENRETKERIAGKVCASETERG